MDRTANSTLLCGVSAELKFQNTPPAKSRPDFLLNNSHREGVFFFFFGISDPGLVKKAFFKVFFHKKLKRASGDEIWTKSDFDRS